MLLPWLLLLLLLLLITDVFAHELSLCRLQLKEPRSLDGRTTPAEIKQKQEKKLVLHSVVDSIPNSTTTTTQLRLPHFRVFQRTDSSKVLPTQRLSPFSAEKYGRYFSTIQTNCRRFLAKPYT